MIKSFDLLPSPVLRPFIDRLWGWESHSPASATMLPVLLPGTGAELYFHIGQPFCFKTDNTLPYMTCRGHLFCIRRSPVYLLPATDIHFIAVRIRTGRLQRFTDIPISALTDRHLSIEAIWGVSGRTLLRQLAYTKNRAEKIALIESFLIGHLKPVSSDVLVEQATQLLYRQYATLSIDALAEHFDLKRRQLERRWKVFSGMTPGETRNLNRFQNALKDLLLRPSAMPVKMTDHALAHGYYDQSHFIHDFRHRTELPHRCICGPHLSGRIFTRPRL